MQDAFLGTPIFMPGALGIEGYLIEGSTQTSPDQFQQYIRDNKLVLCRDFAFTEAAAIFQSLVEAFELQASYEIQMQYVVHTINDRRAVDDVAVTVNSRAPFQLIQPHAEGDSTSPIDLFGLYCFKNAQDGGHNVISLIEQDADHSGLCAKEKAVITTDLTPEKFAAVRGEHFDAHKTLPLGSKLLRVLNGTAQEGVAVVAQAASPSKSRINGQSLTTYWDNITVHDRSFHEHHFELLKAVGLLEQGLGSDFREYAHIESDSSWGPMDTCSGDLRTTASRFNCHVVIKLEPGDFLLFHNRAWTHAANNWPPEQARDLVAMYA